MRAAVLIVGGLVIAGCAGQPANPPASAPATRYVTATGDAQKTMSEGDIDAKRLAEAKKQGYSLVNTNGEILYCRNDLKTGSHIERNTVCLTQTELDDLHNQTRQALQNNIRQNAPPAGK
jgi:hypothetical protein